ncbi:MAG: hypothetical protein C9356_14855 [Oleiphilus sp.]|nr:MAG: hypothetical protein C9356_14855 [Oleiphilus sp.]
MKKVLFFLLAIVAFSGVAAEEERQTAFNTVEQFSIHIGKYCVDDTTAALCESMISKIGALFSQYCQHHNFDGQACATASRESFLEWLKRNQE